MLLAWTGKEVVASTEFDAADAYGASKDYNFLGARGGREALLTGRPCWPPG